MFDSNLVISGGAGLAVYLYGADYIGFITSDNAMMMGVLVAGLFYVFMIPDMLMGMFEKY